MKFIKDIKGDKCLLVDTEDGSETWVFVDDVKSTSEFILGKRGEVLSAVTIDEFIKYIVAKDKLVNNLGFNFKDAVSGLKRLLRVIDIPSTYHTIVDGGCKSIMDSHSFVKEILLPSTMYGLGSRAFESLQVQYIKVSDSYVASGYISYKDISSGGQNDCNLFLPKTLLWVGDACFYSSNLRTVVLPDNLVRMGDRCFAFCSNLISVSLPNSLEVLPYGTFEDCYRLASIDIPDSVTAVEEACFSKCSALKSVSLSKSLRTLGSQCFYSCTSLKTISIPESVVEIDGHCFAECQSLEEVEMQGAVKIGTGCFCGCSKLQRVKFSESLEVIGSQCFLCCYILADLTIPRSVRVIGEQCFSGCLNLRRIRLPVQFKFVFAQLEGGIVVPVADYGYLGLPSNCAIEFY